MSDTPCALQLSRLVFQSTSTVTSVAITTTMTSAQCFILARRSTVNTLRSRASRLLPSPQAVSLKAALPTLTSVCFAHTAIHRKPRTEAYRHFLILGAGGDTWTIQGDGSIPFAVTSIGDIGKYTARAVVVAHQKPSEVPRRLRVYSALK